ncbi:MAG TPA: YheC/YheD family protein [Bacillota bacterium]|nr:YheC/YheD family protein [Bacillota bacterium]
MAPRVGILLDPRTLRGIPSNRTAHEKITYYNRAGRVNGVLPFYMSLDLIRPKQNKAEGYIFSNGYRFVKRSIPKVIHNRSMTFTKLSREKLGFLRKKSTVFNGQTRYSKYRIHQLLDQNADIQSHLPYTVLFSKKNLEMMMGRFQHLFIKPTSGSLGIGVIKIERKDAGWLIHSRKNRTLKSSTKVYPALRKLIGKASYIIQKAIPLAKYKGKPFDIRVSVQRGAEGYWQVTGMVGKVAAKGMHVTNVAGGGKVIRCEELFAHAGLPVETTKKAISTLGVQIALHLGHKLSHLADIGLDIGVDGSGFPYFIEVNGRDLRYSFRNAKLYDNWYKTYENPILYAKYLYHKQEAHKKASIN